MMTKRRSIFAAIAVVALAALLLTLVACDGVAGGKSSLSVEGFRDEKKIVLPIKTAASSSGPKPHGVRYIKSSRTDIAEFTKEIEKGNWLITRMFDNNTVIIERVTPLFEDGEWRAYSEVLFLKPYDPPKDTAYAKKKLNYYISNCVCETDGNNGFDTAFLLPLYLIELPDPAAEPEEGEDMPYRGSISDVEEFYKRSGCEVEKDGDTLTVTDMLGSRRSYQRNITTKYKLTCGDGVLKFEILEVKEYKPALTPVK